MNTERHLTDDQKHDHVQGGGHCCPYCGCESLDGDSFDCDGGVVTQEVTCLECDAVWENTYSLTSLREVYPPQS